MDNFKLPLREIKAKYTKSDIALLAWNSRLQSYNLSLGFESTKSDAPKPQLVHSDPDVISPAGVKETEKAYTLPEGVNNGVHIPKKFFDEEGEIDLRRGSGPEVARYINALGIPLVVMPRGSK